MELNNKAQPRNAGYFWRHGLWQVVLWANEHPIQCAAVFFVLAFALRLLCGSRLGPIAIQYLPDEFRYLHLARSIAEGGPLLIRGLPADFQKILYPLMISPAFLLARDPVAQIKIIEAINCLLMASMMFPLALLVKKLTAQPAVLLMTLLFAAVLPDFIYAAAVMAEPLYWPLCAWVFYFFHRAMAEQKEPKRLCLFAAFGFITWLAYLTKEIAAAFALAVVAILLMEGMRDRSRLAKNGLALTLYLSAFFMPFMIVKQAVFPSVGNSYAGSQSGWDQIGLSALKSPDAVIYMLYSAAVLLMAAILSFYILPVILPLFRLRRMNEKKRRMYLFAVFSLVIIVGAMAYTVSIREDRGDPLPRLHMRLLAPIVIPFIILCFDFLLSPRSTRQKRAPGKQQGLILMAVFCTLLLILLPSVPKDDAWLDHASFSPSYLSAVFAAVDMGKASVNLIWLSYLLFMLAILVTGMICLLQGKKKISLIVLLCAIFAASVSDNITNDRFAALIRQKRDVRSYYAEIMSRWEPEQYFLRAADVLFSAKGLRDPSAIAGAAISVSEHIQQMDDAPDGSIIISMDATTRKFFSTYASQRLPAYMIISERIARYLDEGKREIVFNNYSDTKGLRVNYIVVSEDYNPFVNAEVVYEQTPFLVLRNFDPTRLCIEEPE